MGTHIVFDSSPHLNLNHNVMCILKIGVFEQMDNRRSDDREAPSRYSNGRFQIACDSRSIAKQKSIG